MGLFKADRIVINPPAPAPAPAPAQPCVCPPPAAAQPAPAPPPVATQPAPAPAPSTSPPPGTVQPQVIVVQQAPDQGAWTQNGKHYMSALLASSYFSAKLITATGQAHLLAGATDAQLLEDYRNGDVTASVLSLFQMTVPKGMVQVKQSQVMTSPEFPQIKTAAQQAPVIQAGGAWTFNVPSGWDFTVTASAPILRQPFTGPARVPANITFSVDAMRSTRLPKSDGSVDVTVYGEWTEVFPNGVEDTFSLIPAGTYTAVLIATLYPTDNPPPSS